MIEDEKPYFKNVEGYYIKEIKTYFDKIHVVENFISPSTAKFLVDLQKKYLTVTPHNKFISGGFAGYSITPYEFVSNYSGKADFDIALDLFQNIGNSMVDAVSIYYGTPFVAKTLFYSHMIPGAENKLHMDNHYIDVDGNMKIRENEYDDRAALLYLNDEYTGGELFFPLQNWEYKPKPGTLIFFKGDHTIPHGVKKVESGERVNMISFLYNEKDKLKPRTRPMYESEMEITEEMVVESSKKGISLENMANKNEPWYAEERPV